MTAALDDRQTGVNADGQMTPISGETIDNNSRQLTAAAAAPYWTPGQRQALTLSFVVVREGHHLKSVPENPDTQLKPSQKTGTIGTGKSSSIQAVKTKVVSVFAVMFHSFLSFLDTLSDYSKENLGHNIS